MFICQDCGHSSVKSFVKCSKCKSFNIKEEIIKEELQTFSNQKKITDEKLETINNIDKEYELINYEYLDTGFDELNEMLGGSQKNGLVESSFTLLAGKPGIGKSTLLLQLINNISKKNKSIYISNEESITQIKMRAKRLNLNGNFDISNEANVQKIVSGTQEYDFIIIDSVNTINDGEKSAMDSPKALKQNTLYLMEYAKKYNKTIVLIGQITKADEIAGPKVLEHMVDTVLFFDFFDDQKIYRYIKPKKNRFGKIDFNTIFNMTNKGLEEIKNPSLLFINKDNKEPGNALSLIMESNKPLFVEIQSLLIQTNAEKTITQSIGIDIKRINQIIAIILKYHKIKVYDKNIFINIIGGLTVKKPYLDLAIAASILSSINDININEYIFFGEIGLTGEIRETPNEKNLIENAIKYGYDKDKIISYSNKVGYKHIKDLKKLLE